MSVSEVPPTLPRYISIKGDNGLYLALKSDGLLTFDASQRSNLTSFEVLYDSDGALLIQSSANRRFWRRDSSNYIRANADNADAADRFKASKLDTAGGHLAFQSTKENLFLKRYLGSLNGYNALIKVPDEYSAVIVSDASEDAICLPDYIWLKGDNGKYLHSHWERDVYWLKFHGDTPADDWGTNQIIPLLDGSLALYNVQSRIFWRNSTNWIWIDVSKQEDAEGDLRCHFEPLKLGSQMLALKNKFNGKFCKRLTDYWENSLNAGTDYYTDSEARLEIGDATVKRSIFNVKYLATTSDEKLQLVGRGSLVNDSNHMTDMNVVVTIENKVSKSRTWSNSFTFSQKVTTTFKCGIPFIVDGEVGVEIGTEQSFGNEWGETTEETIQFQTGYLVKDVGPGQTASVTVTCTTAKMRIPFSYQCRDTALGGYDRPVVDYIDGIFEGVAVFNTTAKIDNGSGNVNRVKLCSAEEARAWKTTDPESTACDEKSI